MTNKSTYIHSNPTSPLGLIATIFLRISGFKRKFRNNIKNKTNQVKPRPIPKKYLRELDITTTRINDRDVFRLAPKTNKSNNYILYIHGGAYVNNIAVEHWDLIATIIRKTGATIYVPDYPLAPVFTYSESFPIVEQTYTSLLLETSSDNITIMGDSAGGGFALAFAQKLKKDGILQPKQLILISPWLDATMSNPEIKNVEKKDQMLDVEALIIAAKQWAGTIDTKNYLISPINGNMEGLAPISVFIGAKDVFIADVRKFKGILEQKGISINYFEYPNMFHVWIAVTFLNEAKLAIEQISSLINISNK